MESKTPNTLNTLIQSEKRIQNTTDTRYSLEVNIKYKESLIADFRLINLTNGEVYDGNFEFSPEIGIDSCTSIFKNPYKFVYSEIDGKLTFQNALLPFNLKRVEMNETDKKFSLLMMENALLKNELAKLEDKLTYLATLNSCSKSRVISKKLEGNNGDGGCGVWSYKQEASIEYTKIGDLEVEFEVQSEKAVIICSINGHIGYQGKKGFLTAGFFLDSDFPPFDKKYFNALHGNYYTNGSSFSSWGPICFSQSLEASKGKHTVSLKVHAEDSFIINGGAIQITIIE